MSLPDAAVSSPVLRCHRCARSVGACDVSMRIVGLFKASALGRVPPTHGNEVRKRCRSCGWVNIFHPENDGGEIEVKQIA